MGCKGSRVQISSSRPTSSPYRAALIHHHHPTIADVICQHQGRGSRAQRDAKHQALKQERERAHELRREIESLRADVQRLSSINEVLLAESAALRSRLGDQKVVALKSPKMAPRAPPAGESGAQWPPKFQMGCFRGLLTPEDELARPRFAMQAIRETTVVCLSFISSTEEYFSQR